MAKRKTTTRKTRQAAATHTHPYRAGTGSKHVSASPSPSPQPQDLVQRRRKGTPVRSPSQGDTSKGIVFAFRIQNDSDLSMAVDILSYDQVPDKGVYSTGSPSTTATIAATGAATQANMTAAVAANSYGLENHEFRAESTGTVVSQLKLAGQTWSSDPASYLSNNVVDLSRNMLILHARKPQELVTSSSSSPSSPSSCPSSSQPSTPALSDSASSPSSSPSSPSLFHLPSAEVMGMAGTEKEELCSLDSLSSPSAPFLDDMKSRPARMLSVRGLGAGGRRMQVYLV